MEMIHQISDCRGAVQAARAGGRTIGFVPTMGYLHPGHLSLIRAANSDCDLVVVSLFVNPTQFGPGEDYKRYPRDFDHDAEMCENEGVDILFYPSEEEMYPAGEPLTTVEVKGVTEGLCGRSRPGHFRGVATVVAKLFNIVSAHRAYFGEKDYQQLVVIRRMVADLNFPVEIVGCPIIREADGLAMSSRNAYLSPEERRQATVVSRALFAARDEVAAGQRNAGELLAHIRETISSAPLAQIDYVEIVDADTLQPVEEIAGHTLMAAAVRFGATRLIDNVIVMDEIGRSPKPTTHNPI